MNVWNATVDYPPGAHLCRAPSPTVFAYPAACAVRALGNRSFEGAADRWTEGKDDLSAAGTYKYYGGVLLPDGRVVLVPWNAKHVGLYDPSKDQWTEGKTVQLEVYDAELSHQRIKTACCNPVYSFVFWVLCHLIYALPT